MDPVSRPFDRAPIPVHQEGGINHTKMKGLCQELAKENFIPEEKEVNCNQNPHVAPKSSISLKPKTPDLLNLSDYQKVYPFVKTLFRETRETFPLAGRLKYFLKNWEKVRNDSTILSRLEGYSIDLVETPYQPITPVRAKLKKVQEELVSQEMKEMLENSSIRETIH